MTATIHNMDILHLYIFPIILTVLAVCRAKDYCNSDEFEATCPEHHVIIMTHAQYGRMQQGKCVQRNFGFVGCGTDVKPILDRKCSGRSRCSVRVADPELEAVSECDKEFKSYLSAEFICQQVINVPDCTSNDPLLLTSPSGNLSSLLPTQPSECGTSLKPWRIEGLPGQSVSFYLHDFTADTRGMAGLGASCGTVYAVLTEPDTNTREQVCGGRARYSHVFTSVRHVVHVQMLKSQGQTDDNHFLLEYQVSGCEDMRVPSGTMFERHGDTAFIQCPHSARKWQITCEAGQWIGEHRNCTEDELQDISVALVLSVAFVISCCIFVVGIFVIRRQNAQRLRRQREAILMMEARDAAFSKYPAYPPPSHVIKGQGHKSQGHQDVQGQTKSSSRVANQSSVENDYAYIADFPPPPSPKTLRRMEKGAAKNINPNPGISSTSGMARQSILPLQGQGHQFEGQRHQFAHEATDLFMPYELNPRLEELKADQRKSL